MPVADPANNPTRSGESDLFDLDSFSAEMQRLSAVNRELMGTQPSARPVEDVGAHEVALLRLENAELRARVEELEASVHGRSNDSWAERQREYEALLEEKSEVIRTLHLKIRELQERPQASPAATAADVAGHTKKIEELEEQRRQLEEDEQAMLEQLRQMEMALSRDRAELARQRQEVRNMHDELARALEAANRDPGLRERLQKLSRPEKARSEADIAITPPTPPNPKKSGIFGKIWG